MWPIYLLNKILLSEQSSLSIFAQNYLPKCEDTYFILQNKYLHMYEDSFGANILRDDRALTIVTTSMPSILFCLFTGIYKGQCFGLCLS